MRMSRWLAVCGLLVAFLYTPVANADESAKKGDAKTYEQIVGKAIDYLSTKGQAADGSFNAAAGPGVTGLVTAAILSQGRTPADPVVAKGLKYLEGFVRKDGGIYGEGSFHKNYETSLAVMALSQANRGGKYDAILKKAEAFLRENQWGGEDGKQASDIEYGGAGYGKNKRPDLSNTSFMIDALHATGGDENSEAIQRALIFVSRCQNLETEHNTTPFAAKNPDGGFYYTPAAGGSSQAGIDDSTGGLRSYASMTYAGLKSMIYAGVKKDDPRVKAAVGWLKKHYSLDENPGMGTAGLYYYYHIFAKALNALGQDKFVDEKGVSHDWRSELIAELASRQRADGSWVNENSRWLEGDANIVTGYALLALAQAKK
jgi:squalene-hopene/tetraprenyl-beta-curcumene cyclase